MPTLSRTCDRAICPFLTECAYRDATRLLMRPRSGNQRRVHNRLLNQRSGICCFGLVRRAHARDARIDYGKRLRGMPPLRSSWSLKRAATNWCLDRGVMTISDSAAKYMPTLSRTCDRAICPSLVNVRLAMRRDYSCAPEAAISAASTIACSINARAFVALAGRDSRR